MKSGLAITTFFRRDTNPERLSIFKKSIGSLLVADCSGPIFLVDDGLEGYCEHINWLSSIDSKNRITVIKRAHGGIAKAKNTCIKLLLDSGIDIGFLADDDIVYKDSAWESIYIEAVNKTGIDHLSFYNSDEGCDLVDFNGYCLRRTPKVNGCLITFTKRLVASIGFFKILPNDYGHEHSNFSFRASNLFGQNGFYDIVDSKKYIELIPESGTINSIGKISSTSVDENGKLALHSGFKYEPFIE